ncbi:unnamed protein product, partial [Heterotrigona itama]
MTRCTTVRSPLEGLTGRTIERICHVEAITRTNKAVKSSVIVTCNNVSQGSLTRNNERIEGRQDIALGQFYNVAL